MAITRTYNQPVTAPIVQPVVAAPLEPSVVETAPPLAVVTPMEEATILTPAEAKAEEAPPQNRVWTNGFILEWNPDSMSARPAPEKPADVDRMTRTTLINLQGRGGARIEIVVIPGGITEESEVTAAEKEAEVTEPPVADEGKVS